MTKVIDRILAKVTRAQQHIQDLQLGLAAFYDSKPYEIATKEDAKVGKRVYYVSKIDPVPLALTAIAADVVQNLRSPLDQLAYQLVLHSRGGAKPEWKVYYPICGSASHYQATRKGVIKGVPKAVIDAIDATEPYKGGKGHALWQLQQLRNPDQHELLLRTDEYFRSVDVAPSLRDAMHRAFGRQIQVPPIWLRPKKRSPLKVGHQLYSEPLNREMVKDMQFRIDVSLYKSGVIEGEPVIKTLHDLSNLVGGIIREFAPFLR